jgi:toxin ParE1/3/4
MRLEFHPATAAELNDAVSYLNSQRSGLGAELKEEIEKTINRIAEAPLRYRLVSGEIRRCFVNRFPFSVLYRVVDEGTVRILVIRHHRLRSSYGAQRQ